MLKCTITTYCIAALLLAPPAQAGEILVSIKPLHSLVARVMGETGTPILLVQGAQSPHGYQLKPSQVKQLQHADMVFMIDAQFETFLTRPVQNAPQNIRAISMAELPGITLLKPREGGTWEPHQHHADIQSGHEHADFHIWLDIQNVKIMVTAIADALSALHPENSAIYHQNATTTTAKLNTLDTELKKRLQSVTTLPFIVFHDAFQYFERAYGLRGAGSITLEPEQAPGAKRISHMRHKVRELNVKCVFAEPQFNSGLIQTITEGTQAKTGMLDEHGSGIEPGAELYFTLMHQLAMGFADCLHTP